MHCIENANLSTIRKISIYCTIHWKFFLQSISSSNLEIYMYVHTHELPLICLRRSEQISYRHFDVDDELAEKNESNVKNHDASLFDQTDELPLRDCWIKCLIRCRWLAILELCNLEQARTLSICNIHYWQPCSLEWVCWKERYNEILKMIFCIYCIYWDVKDVNLRNLLPDPDSWLCTLSSPSFFSRP